MSVKYIKVRTLLIIWAASFAGACISNLIVGTWSGSAWYALFNGALLVGMSYHIQRKEDQNH